MADRPAHTGTGPGARAKVRIPKTSFRAYQRKDIDSIPQLQRLPKDELLAMKAVSAVLPFRVNQYVVENLISQRHMGSDGPDFL